MALTGKIMDFFADKAMTIPAFPRTKVKAVSDDNGVGLDAILNTIVYAEDFDSEIVVSPLNADTLEGHNVNSLMNKIYPVGSIYMSVNSVSPDVLFGGTWEALKDRFLLGAGEYTTAGSTGGEAEHTLTIAEMPSHCHTMLYSGGTASNWGYDYSNSGGTTSAQTTASGGVGLTGDSQPHNNIPPFLSVYMWKRTA